MIKIPKTSYTYPLSPKVERPPIPVGHIELNEAVELLGLAMFPGEWTREERAAFREGAFGQRFGSEIEYETNQAFRMAVTMAQCKKKCEIYGGDPAREFQLRTKPSKDDDPWFSLGDLPTLSKKETKEIEARYSDDFNRAKSVRHRRKQVEDRFLREMLWSGTLQGFYVAWDGRLSVIEPHTWGGPNGKRDFERGWVKVSGDDGGTEVRSILINQAALDAILRSPLSNSPALDAAPLEANSDGEQVDSSKGASRRFSESAVQKWYRGYVIDKLAAGEKSTRDADLQAARKHFKTQIPRETMRTIRRKLAPPEWSKKGRPKTGKK